MRLLCGSPVVDVCFMSASCQRQEVRTLRLNDTGRILIPTEVRPCSPSTTVAFGNPLHPSKIFRPSTNQTSQSEPNRESAYLEAHKRNAPAAKRNLARHDPRLPRSRGCQNGSDFRRRHHKRVSFYLQICPRSGVRLRCSLRSQKATVFLASIVPSCTEFRWDRLSFPSSSAAWRVGANRILRQVRSIKYKTIVFYKIQ